MSYINCTVKDQKNLYDGYNETFDTNILDDDKVVDELEEIIEEDGGNIIDFHSCELFPEQEAKESYSEEIVVELQSNNTDDIENNLSRIEEWIKNWKILNNNN
ncbi:9396_t:CDS:2 [Entrophospora sp. SA101]|nr:9396_t:CDS:2 [Entrophospora sp. SA101]